jgi:hypothetical protein
MSHLSEEQLVLHYYGEAEDPRTAEEHLGACDDCRARFQALQATLKDVSLPVPERGEEYGAQVWRRLRPRPSCWGASGRARRLNWLSPPPRKSASGFSWSPSATTCSARKWF